MFNDVYVLIKGVFDLSFAVLYYSIFFLFFFTNIRPSNVQKEFSFFAFFCAFSSLMMDCRNFVRSSVIKMLSLLFLRF